MTYRLFIDDERYPTLDKEWQIARTSDDAILIVRMLGLPMEIAFDHDLGGDDTAMKFLHWFSDYLIENNLKLPMDFTYSIHSQNPIGKANIQSYMFQIIGYFK